MADGSQMECVMTTKQRSSFERARDRFEIPVLIAALLVVPVMLIEERATSDLWQTIAVAGNWAIWGVFFVEYVALSSLARDRWAYTRKAWLDVVIIVTSFPLLPTLLAGSRLMRLTRLSRVLRLLRLVRLAAVLSRGGATVRRIFATKGMGYFVMITVILAFGFGGVFAFVESTNFLDGVWWAVVTLTTVGYGDTFPVTGLGRVAGIGLMMTGIGFVAVLTAAIAARFVEDDEEDLITEVQRIHVRLDQIEAMLAQANGGTSSN